MPQGAPTPAPTGSSSVYRGSSRPPQHISGCHRAPQSPPPQAAVQCHRMPQDTTGCHRAPQAARTPAPTAEAAASGRQNLGPGHQESSSPRVQGARRQRRQPVDIYEYIYIYICIWRRHRCIHPEPRNATHKRFVSTMATKLGRDSIQGNHAWILVLPLPRNAASHVGLADRIQHSAQPAASCSR